MKRFITLLVFITAILICFFVYQTYQYNRPIPDGAVALEFPLKNGGFLTVQSGKFGNIHTTPVEKYALDIVRSPSLASFFKFRQAGLESDATYGTPVYSPCLGRVKKVRDGISDQPIGIKNRAAGSGNTVIIGCYGFDIMMAHFKINSIKVKEGDQIQIGEDIGQIGNSGNTDGPHLHIMAYLSNDLSGEKTPLPITFAGKYLRRGDNFTN